MTRGRAIPLPGIALLLAAASVAIAQTAAAGRLSRHARHGDVRMRLPFGGTATPIKHVVVIFQENVSFDHYFGTYPYATNKDGQNFRAAGNTSAVDGLLPATSRSLPPSLRHSTNLLTANPNTALPKRLDSTATGKSSDAGGQLTCDQDHDDSDEEQAFDGGKMDQFVGSVGTGSGTSPFGTPCDANTVMHYFDGNTVTGLWNYAQHFSMSDDSFGTTFGPSSPGAINLASGDTGNVDTSHMVNSPSVSTPTSPNGDITPDGHGGFSLTSDAHPYWDDCSTRDAVALSGQNIGDELNAAGLSWGWFEGGLRPTTSYQDALADVGASGQPTSTFIPDQFKAFVSNVANRPANSTNQSLCDQVHPVAWRSAERASGVSRTTTSRTTSRSTTTPP
jgi:phospholipase C